MVMGNRKGKRGQRKGKGKSRERKWRGKKNGKGGAMLLFPDQKTQFHSI